MIVFHKNLVKSQSFYAENPRIPFWNKNPLKTHVRAAKRGKAAKAWPLDGFCTIEIDGGSGGTPVKVPPLWRPCLPKIYHGNPSCVILLWWPLLDLTRFWFALLFNDGSLTNSASSHSFQHVNQNLVDVFQETSIRKRKHCLSVFLFILTFCNAKWLFQNSVRDHSNITYYACFGGFLTHPLEILLVSKNGHFLNPSSWVLT